MYCRKKRIIKPIVLKDGKPNRMTHGLTRVPLGFLHHSKSTRVGPYKVTRISIMVVPSKDLI
jgi:hypothetical protein